MSKSNNKVAIRAPLVKLPLVVKPITAKPITAKPITAKPITAKPIAAKPIVARPRTNSYPTKKKTIIVFTDGSCLDNGKANAVGGIGIHFPDNQLKDVSKVFKDGICTNQRAELYAILCALRYIKQNIGLKNVKVLIKTDSQYSINCVTKWVTGWIRNGWKTKGNTPVANKEFIEIIHKYYEHFDIEFEHVDGHSSAEDSDAIGNDRADELAVMASNKALKEREMASETDFDTYTTLESVDYDRRTKRNTKRNTKPVKQVPVKRAPTKRKYNSKTAKPKIVAQRVRNNGFHVNGFPKGNDFIVELIKSK